MSFTGGRSVEPSTQTGVELWPTNEGKKKGDKSDDCWDTRMMAADVVACSGGRRDCGFSSPLSFFPPENKSADGRRGEKECVARKRREGAF